MVGWLSKSTIGMKGKDKEQYNAREVAHRDSFAYHDWMKRTPRNQVFILCFRRTLKRSLKSPEVRLTLTINGQRALT